MEDVGLPAVVRTGRTWRPYDLRRFPKTVEEVGVSPRRNRAIPWDLGHSEILEGLYWFCFINLPAGF